MRSAENENLRNFSENDEKHMSVCNLQNRNRKFLTFIQMKDQRHEIHTCDIDTNT